MSYHCTLSRSASLHYRKLIDMLINAKCADVFKQIKVDILQPSLKNKHLRLK